MKSLIFKTSKFLISLKKFNFTNKRNDEKIISQNNKNVCLLYAAFAIKKSSSNTLINLRKREDYEI